MPMEFPNPPGAARRQSTSWTIREVPRPSWISTIGVSVGVVEPTYLQGGDRSARSFVQSGWVSRFCGRPWHVRGRCVSSSRPGCPGEGASCGRIIRTRRRDRRRCPTRALGGIEPETDGGRHGIRWLRQQRDRFIPESARSVGRHGDFARSGRELPQGLPELRHRGCGRK